MCVWSSEVILQMDQLADGVHVARHFGKLLFGNADHGDNSNSDTSQQSAAATSTKDLRHHPASPKAAESLRVQRSVTQSTAMKQDRKSTENNNIARQQQVALPAPTEEPSCALTVASFLPVIPVNSMSTTMVKNLLRTRDCSTQTDGTIDVTARSLNAAQTKPDDRNDSAVSAAAKVGACNEHEGYSELLNIHQGNRGDVQQTVTAANVASDQTPDAPLAAGKSASAVGRAHDVSDGAASNSSGQPEENDLVLVVVHGSSTTVPLPSLVKLRKRKHEDASSPNTNSAQSTSAVPPAKVAKLPTVDEAVFKDLKHFADHFKLRRMQLGYTQTKVGRALQEVHGSMFSQTTVCRFENMQLSLANASTLRPVLEEWLAKATPLPGSKNFEPKTDTKSRATDNAGATAMTTTTAAAAAISNPPALIAAADLYAQNERMERESSGSDETPITPAVVASAHSPGESPRKRPPKTTSQERAAIGNKSREALEQIYVHNPKPSSKQIQDIAQDLQLAKGTVRVWFCNRRQRENRMRSIMIKSGMSN